MDSGTPHRDMKSEAALYLRTSWKRQKEYGVNQAHGSTHKAKKRQWTNDLRMDLVMQITIFY